MEIDVEVDKESGVITIPFEELGKALNLPGEMTKANATADNEKKEIVIRPTQWKVSPQGKPKLVIAYPIGSESSWEYDDLASSTLV